ncbi:MAG TPA: hypothetical protein VGU24_01075 [Microvirga sp.]|jgi:hypothetical protein|nr:hypothetical protein [Microvirga sp.]
MTRTVPSRPLFDLNKLNDIKVGSPAAPLPDLGAADAIGERLGFGDGRSSQNPAQDLQDRAEQAFGDTRATAAAAATKPGLPPRLEALSPREPLRLAAAPEPTPPPVRERVSLQRRLTEASDLVGVRVSVADANRFKLFAARHRLTAGEALTYLLDVSGVEADGSVKT